MLLIFLEALSHRPTLDFPCPFGVDLLSCRYALKQLYHAAIHIVVWFALYSTQGGISCMTIPFD
jgi:hypothetical protein